MVKFREWHLIMHSSLKMEEKDPLKKKKGGMVPLIELWAHLLLFIPVQ